MAGVGCILIACIITLLQKGSSTEDGAVLIPILLNGIGYSLFEASFWVAITYAVPKKLVGSAYGVAIVFGNVAGVIVPLTVAFLQEADKSETGEQLFGYTMWLFILMCIIAEGLLVLLYIDDIKKRDGALNKVYFDVE
jgi:MFS family permease